MPQKGDINLLKIGELARLADVLPSTINYYTKEGLLHFAKESRGGYRLYHRQQSLRRLETIKKYQKKQRLTVAEIRKKLK
ncbi:MAG: MerR family transcriptional regulator [Candidatus Buchananbacteria bacterium]|jgi:MerR family Zn(II)-responsive transcriptional regulator of zntA